MALAAKWGTAWPIVSGATPGPTPTPGLSPGTDPGATATAPEPGSSPAASASPAQEPAPSATDPATATDTDTATDKTEDELAEEEKLEKKRLKAIKRLATLDGLSKDLSQVMADAAAERAVEVDESDIEAVRIATADRAELAAELEETARAFRADHPKLV
jgi:hypothetical protein